jgi:hypothetical protein
MPIQFTVEPQARLIVYVVEGNATSDEARLFLDAVLAHPAYQRGFTFLGDRRDVVRGPTSAYVYGITDEVNARATQIAPCRWAVIVSDTYAYGMARMWAIMTERSGVQILPFRTAKAATDWLGVDESYVPARFVTASNCAMRVGGRIDD